MEQPGMTYHVSALENNNLDRSWLVTYVTLCLPLRASCPATTCLPPHAICWKMRRLLAVTSLDFLIDRAEEAEGVSTGASGKLGNNKHAESSPHLYINETNIKWIRKASVCKGIRHLPSSINKRPCTHRGVSGASSSESERKPIRASHCTHAIKYQTTLHRGNQIQGGGGVRSSIVCVTFPLGSHFLPPEKEPLYSW